MPPAPAPAGDDAATAVVSLYRSEAKIQPRAVHGVFAAWRVALVWATQLFFYGMPWLQWNGRQAVLFDLPARRFFLGPLVLYPQDFIYLTGLLVVCAYSLFLFTAVAGRVWCGYACPQTVYTEIFMWVEHRFEGDRAARIRLDQAGWSLEKWLRRGGKHAVWIAIGLATGFSFVGWFTPVRLLGDEVLASVGLLAGPALGGWEAFWILFYGFATYGNAGFMREQVCKYMCPYARFQSAMFDRDTWIVGYDTGRGEPRGSRPRSMPHSELAARGKGDCIDCTLCVQVCPTGIDIRKGLQYECIGCAACIDVCDDVMDRMGYPRGLIRYASQNAIANGWTRAQQWRRALRPRVLIYTGVLVLIVAAFVTSLVLRTPFRVDVVRDRGTLGRLVEAGWVENVYRMQVMNATESAQTFTVRAEGLDSVRLSTVTEFTVPATQSRWIPVGVRISPDAAAALGPGAHAVELVVERQLGPDDPPAVVREKSTFLVPR
ncbi:MAG: cytochrome c oxidase accessory protein CcoG [Burkholderiales bacterium]|nr:cytochrome c oxidase accessory protein CcoG [Burkholderiales bacterium]